MASDNSIITVYRRQMLCQYTSGAISSFPKINRIAFGDGGVNGSGDPVAPTATQAALTNQIAIYPIDSGFPTYPLNPPTTARYQVTIPAADMAGKTINEAALIDTSGKACAIKTMYNKRKDAGVTFTFTFDDEF